MYNFFLHSDEEDFIGGELEDVYDSTQFPSQPPTHGFGEIETMDDYTYIPQQNEPQTFHPSTGDAPLNLSVSYCLEKREVSHSLCFRNSILSIT